jgi:type VI protein secretion system component Hcp
MKSRKTKKSLRKGKKLESTKPLKVSVHDISIVKHVDKASPVLLLS